MSLPNIQQIKGFTILPIQLPSSAASTKKTYHYIYLKKHTTKSQSESQTRSLFIVNTPINSNFTNMKKLFSDVAIGSIIESFESKEFYDANGVINYDVDVDLSQLTNEELVTTENGKSAVGKVPVGCGILTFLDKNGLNLALTSIKKLVSLSNNISKLPVWKLDESETGTARYIVDPKLDSKKLSEEVSRDMRDFQLKEQEVKDSLNTMKSLVDDDGFTLVVGSHRKTKNGILGSIKKAADLEANKEALKKMKKKEKQDFYRFQIRERKKLEMNELLSKFKEDQERVKQMKEKRKFKPY